MSYSVETRWGGSEREPSTERMREILAELDVPDAEHPDTWLTHESGWTLTAFESGRLVLEHDATDASVRHLASATREHMLTLWCALAAGRLDEVERQPWLPGHGRPPITDADRAASAAALRRIDRAFYDRFGAEREDTPCRAPGCSRGAVRASVFCRPHHFEQVRRRPCPFDD